MAVTRTTFGPRAGRTHHVAVDVQDQTVRSAVNAVLTAVSPLGLHEFLAGEVSDYFEDQIINRFASHGGPGVPGGSWPPLRESTLRIRHALGYYDDEAINERTGELMQHVAYTRSFTDDVDGSTMTIPEDTNDPILERKLAVAQLGAAANPMVPGSTPPRPVLGIEDRDEVAVHRLLTRHVELWVAARLHA